MKFLGDRFVDAIKIFIPFIIFLTIVSGISGMSDLEKSAASASRRWSILKWSLPSPWRSASSSLTSSSPAGSTRIACPPVKRRRVAKFSWGDFFIHNLTLQVLLLAIIVGIILSLHPRRLKVLPYIHLATGWVFTALKYFMFLAPVGAFGGMAFTIGKYGIRLPQPLGHADGHRLWHHDHLHFCRAWARSCAISNSASGHI